MTKLPTKSMPSPADAASEVWGDLFESVLGFTETPSAPAETPAPSSSHAATTGAKPAGKPRKPERRRPG
jgi:hypothetical protein